MQQNQQPQILDPQTFQNQLKLLNLPPLFKNTVMFYMQSSQQTAMMCNVLMPVATKCCLEKDDKTIFIKGEELKPLSRNTLDVGQDEKGNITISIAKKVNPLSPVS